MAVWWLHGGAQSSYSLSYHELDGSRKGDDLARFGLLGGPPSRAKTKGKPELRRDGRIDAGDASRLRDREADSRFSDAVRRRRLVQEEWPELRLLRGAFAGRR